MPAAADPRDGTSSYSVSSDLAITDSEPEDAPAPRSMRDSAPSRPSVPVGVVGISLGMAAYFVATAVLGVVRNWHPLPFWDMWNSYLGFWYQLQDGNLGAWWQQNNEHRIVLAKAVFWLDFRWFHGDGWFPVVCTLVALGCVTVLLVLLARWRLVDADRWPRARLLFAVAAGSLVALSWSWIQYENLIWGFQVPFLLASLLPFGAFFALGATSACASPEPRHENLRFASACILFALAPWSTAAGLTAPFLGVLLALLLRLGWTRTSVVGVIAIASALVYRIDYVTPAQHSDPLQSIIQHPWGVTTYLLTYLGGPVRIVTGDAWLGSLSGAFLLAATTYYLIRQVRTANRSAPGLVAVFYLIFAIATGILTAAGRLGFGEEQSLTSRYQTPLVVAWGCLLILALPRIEAAVRAGSAITLIALLAVPVVMLPQQVAALTEMRATLFGRDVAELAIALGIPDPEGVAAVFPEPTLPVLLGRRAMADGLTSLARPPFAGLTEGLGKPVVSVPLTNCESRVDARTPVPGTAFSRLGGWIRSDVPLSSTSILTVSDESLVVGYLVSGAPRPDVQAIITGAGPNAGVYGYVASSSTGDLLVGGDLARCRQPFGK